MQTDNSHERKKKFITFGVLLFITVALVALLLSSLSKDGSTANTMPATKAGEEKTVLMTNDNNQVQQLQELLQQKLAALQQSDKAFAASLTATNSTQQQDSLNVVIGRQELNFANAIDSAAQIAGKFTDEKTKNDFLKLITAFQSQSLGRQAFGSLRTAVAMNKDGFTTDEKALLRLQQELTEKNVAINKLENSLKAAAAKNTVVAGNDGATASNEKALGENIGMLEAKVAALTLANNTLKQDNDNLAKQQAETGKSASSNELALKDKASNLQIKVESLNAELQLLRVDCNLNRVDATQIISTAKQRKQLLTEASAILTDLSATGNADIKKKVKDKIVRLNQVAGNTRD